MKAGGDNDNKNFVVQSMTTANQRASSKSSTGSAHSFIQKLTTTQKAGVVIAQNTNPSSGASASVLHGSAQAAMSAFNRDSSYMTAKQAELHNMRMRSQEAQRYPPSSFADQNRSMNNPETDINRSHMAGGVKSCSEFTIGAKEQQF